MRKNLLLTTALVAFALPVYATDTISGEHLDVKGEATVTANSVYSGLTGSIGGAITVYKKIGNLKIDNGAEFSNNSAQYDGGAIGNYGGAIVASNVKFVGNKAQLNAANDSRHIGGGAISLGVDATLDVTDGYFSGNESHFNGGAIATRRTLEEGEYGVSTENHYMKITGSTFIGNKALDTYVDIVDSTNNYKDKGGNGGAISNYFNTAVITGSTFEGNYAKNSGGAIHNAPLYDYSTHAKRYDTGNISIDSSTFKDNIADYQGGAILSAIGASVTLTGEEKQNEFKNNHAYYDGGAIASFGELSISNSLFEGNTAHYTGNQYSEIVSDSLPIGGGAIALGAVSDTKIASITNTTFKDNKSGTNGGAIGTRLGSDADNSQAKLNIDATFTGNYAHNNGGAIYNTFYAGDNGVTVTGKFTSNTAGNNGGAIYNDGAMDNWGKNGNYGGKMTITDSTFTSNTANNNGGAIYNSENATINLKGTNVFSGNTAAGKLNDIYNEGTINVSGDLTLDGGIAGAGHVEFDNATLTAKLDTTTIAAKTVTIKDSTLNLILGDDVKVGKHDFVTATQDGVFDIENTLYNITHLTTGEINVETKSTTEITDSLGVTDNEANALIAATSASSENQDFNNVANALSAAAQAGDASAAKEAQKLGADVNPVVSSQEAGSHEALFTVVSNELGGENGAMAGMSSGDIFKKASAWIRGLFNKADHEATSKSSGFNSDTYGVAMGIDKQVNSNTRLGFGYANSQTDIESDGRDTDVDTNSLFLYSQYKPANWYVNTVLAYSWSEYDETKSVMGANAGAKYDVDTIALQSMYGYETKFKGHDVTPEFGFRYLHTEQDAYTDKLGTTIAANSEDVLTLVAGAKVAKNYKLDNGTVLRPEVKAAITYDLFDSTNSANVTLANGAGYVVDGEKLNRLGFEFGAKVATNVTDKVEVSAGYLTRVREDYQDHTVTFDARYNF